MKLTTFTPSRLAALLCAGAMGFAVQAHALDIDASSLTTSSTWSLGTNYWTVPSGPPAPAVDAAYVQSTTGSGPLESAYKRDYAGSEDKVAAPYYKTTFSLETIEDETEPVGGSITWESGLWINCPECFLVVKDGSNDPSAYIFDLGSWNGTETITLSNFWAGTQGAISYVEIFGNATDGGGPPLMVPEADTYAMLLAGLGLVGFAARRKLNKTA